MNEEPQADPADTATPSGSPSCSVCLDFDWAEEDAESTGDLSLATDWRVLRRRHDKAEHPERAARFRSG
ncbi:hypothetical protein [Streptomyces sp. NBC_00102]|uniref:hypothetical protein n=1 Tax=Streptomyces sp. NBC_00102 TaxID=2975652 RepID=UPI00225AEAC8|nr:hypothetical protein [Streptomyces sp. NBC_00102]MCX5399245.1 hypothetical protein [Streptomyces sp. NBC_00102]